MVIHSRSSASGVGAEEDFNRVPAVEKEVRLGDVVIDSQPKDAPDGPLVVVASTICPVSSAVPRLVLFPSESGGKR